MTTLAALAPIDKEPVRPSHPALIAGAGDRVVREYQPETAPSPSVNAPETGRLPARTVAEAAL
jgi:hypothetical protein